MPNKIEGEKNLTRAGRGRPKGSPNKTTKAAKDLIAEAAEKIGGLDRMVAWVKLDVKNEHAFWATIYPKLLPLQLHGAGDGGEHLHKIVREIVDPANPDS